MKKIVLLGSGNIATLMYSVLQTNNFFQVTQIYSRNEEHAKTLADRFCCDYTSKIECIKKADIYVSVLKDDVSESIWNQIRFEKSILIHTSGSLDISVMKKSAEHFGVIYPLMTISKYRIIDSKKIPVFIEYSDSETKECIEQLCGDKFHSVTELDSKSRSKLHLAAVFANNFSNYMFSVSEGILKKNGISFDLMFPIIEETVEKIHYMSPFEAQTGPAIRFDKKIIDKHLSMLSGPEKEVYQTVSTAIFEMYKHK